jgi:4,5-dihydroxyphthalate decarboxylase
MANLQISIACGDYDRFRDIRDGVVGVTGCDVQALVIPPEEVFHRAFHNREFVVSELSMSSYLSQIDQGINDYVGIPVFISRLFRHSAIYVRKDSPIKKPADMKGKIVGVPEYTMTAALWVRGFLDDQFGVKPSELRWRTGGLHQPGRTPKVEVKLPPEIEIERITDKALNNMLLSGELDVLISARHPANFEKGDFVRLLPDYRTAEKEYFKQTGIFPMMHIVGIRKDYVEKHPWLPNEVYTAFIKAKELAEERLADGAALTMTLPWLVPELAETKALMGEDYWPYGVHENTKTLEAMVRHAYEHGSTKRRLKVEELFDPSTIERSKV